MSYTLAPTLAALPPLGFTLPPRDMRFAPAPSELCQLASDFTGEREFRGDYRVEEKMDGIRLLWIAGQLVTREGEPMACAEHLRPLFERLEHRCGRPMFFDSEYCEGDFLATLAAFRRGNGSGKAWLFDGMPVEEWRAGGGEATLAERRSLLERAFADDFRPAGLDLVTQEPFTAAGFNARLAEIWAWGGEGLMLKRASAAYRRGRSADWCKVKRALRLDTLAVEMLKDGAALAVSYRGRRLRVAVPPPLRDRVRSFGQSITDIPAVIKGMEFTATGAIRQGQLVGIGGEA